MEPAKFDPTSHTLTNDLKAQLKTLVPEAFTEEAIDFDRLKTLLGEMVDVGQERYSFTWPGKTQAIRAAQTPSIGTLVPDKEASEDWDTTGNLYLEGDNLEILKLLQKSYTGKVKMIYIDPPYNTGKDFVYPDNYGEGLKTYLEYTGQVDGEGKKITTNTETDGRYHSKWLNMMYPRLMLARNLLKEDGVIFISIDDHEQANLKKICDEVYGAENFIAQVIWERAYSPVNTKRYFSESHDYVLVYAKRLENIQSLSLTRSEDANARYENPDNDKRGPWKSTDFSVGPRVEENCYEITTPSGRVVTPPTGRSWVVSQERYRELYADNRVWFGADGTSIPSKKSFLNEVKDGITPMTLWKYSDVGHSQDATKRLKKLFDDKSYFDYPKSVPLIKRMIDLVVKDDDIVLDFFSGSATTAHAVMELNAEDGGDRKFILTQLQETLAEGDVAFQDGYKDIAELGRERIKRAGAKIKAEFAEKLEERETPLDTGFRTYRLSSSTFNTWDATSDDDMQAKLLKSSSLIKNGSREEDVLTELILKSGYGLSLPVEQREIGGIVAHSIADGELLMVLSGSISPEAARAIAESSPKRFIARESAFGSDADLTNTAQIMKDKGIDFRVL